MGSTDEEQKNSNVGIHYWPKSPNIEYLMESGLFQLNYENDLLYIYR